ncbi:branched-chain amino acid ABC transporter permease [Acuticoccus sp. I52.16.1]|uniref:branched-chain amino acid ABC transporter permease n=1 Tax=Acuticoccus sp. I52.16.1 TaxID=2928472 RepID=UPI001FD50EED|nr:branched-chain amino acid ABC transporter permease [Acuticoccus sp. I52.16.1]UOM36443.1 branched-chain amino acid ABC transporter permease [Acuticoccus sp. I52.16.1]
MDFVIQQSVNALSLGGIYAMLALGLAIVFSIVRLINFAHGEIMTVGGYGVFAATAFGLPIPFAVATGIFAAVFAAVAMERVAFRAMRGASVVSLLITSFAISEILKVLFQNGISARPKPIALPASLSGTYQLGDITVGVVPTISIVTTLLALLGLTLFLRRTETGMAMRAAAEDFEMLRLLGVRADRVVAAAFALSGLLAGMAAVVWTAQRGSVDPLMGFYPVLKAFIATVLGGLGSLSGAILGGFFVGAVEVFSQAFLPDSLSPYRDAIVLTTVIAVLLVRPDGLVPAAKVDRS